MRMTTRAVSGAGGLCLLALLAGAALGTARADDADPPARVARLSDVEGSVSLQPAGAQEWSAATLNRPITTGDQLWSDHDSRAELDTGAAVIRLGDSTGFSFLNLDDRNAQMQLATGTLIVRVRDMQSGESYEIDTPNMALSLQQAGEYRVEVDAAGNATVVKVSEGAALADAGGQRISIGAQQTVSFTGTDADAVAANGAGLGPPDDLDNWSSAREREVEDSPSEEYVANDTPGAQDLDNNGQWQQTPEYGYVWVPTAVATGWVPYRFGHWVWIAPWGWTWVDDARWGYAPFHYGRWVPCNNTWCWVPGPRRARAVYAPALVAWVGGSAVGTSVPFGSNVGWFPLGPHEAYVPVYHASSTYVRNLNITNTTLVDSVAAPTHYVNNRAAAVTAVPQNIFTSGQRVAAHAMHLPTGVLTGAVVAATAPAIAPIRQSVLGPAESHGVARPPAGLMNRTVMARTPPPRAPTPFDSQLAAIQANGGHPLSHSELAQLQPATPAVRARMLATSSAVVAASALPRGAPSARASSAGRSVGRSGAAATLTDRERALQVSHLPPAPHSNSSGSSAAARDSYAVREWSDEHPPGDELHLPPTQQRAFAADDPTHSHGHPSSVPVYHPPVVADNYAAPAASAHPGSSHHAPPPPAQPRPPSYSHTQTPSHPPSSKEPRDMALHGDRESRERLVR
jgi:FecR protein